VSSADWGGLLPILVLGVLAWFLFIRPARKRAQDVQRLQNQLSSGDDVMLTSGFFGRVIAIDDDRIQVELAPGTVVTVHRGAIGKIVTDVSAESASESAPESEEFDEAPYEQASDVAQGEPGAPDEGDAKSREAN